MVGSLQYCRQLKNFSQSNYQCCKQSHHFQCGGEQWLHWLRHSCKGQPMERKEISPWLRKTISHKIIYFISQKDIKEFSILIVYTVCFYSYKILASAWCFSFCLEYPLALDTALKTPHHILHLHSSYSIFCFWWKYPSPSAEPVHKIYTSIFETYHILPVMNCASIYYTLLWASQWVQSHIKDGSCSQFITV